MNHKEKYKNLFSFSKHEIADFFKHAPRVYRCPDLDLLCRPALFSYGRFLPITPRRIGSAPERNKIRRQLKAIFYENNLSTCSLDCLAVLKKESLTRSFDELERLVLTCLQKAAERHKKRVSSHEDN